MSANATPVHDTLYRTSTAHIMPLGGYAVSCMGAVGAIMDPGAQTGGSCRTARRVVGALWGHRPLTTASSAHIIHPVGYRMSHLGAIDAMGTTGRGTGGACCTARRQDGIPWRHLTVTGFEWKYFITIYIVYLVRGRRVSSCLVRS